jgi:hypothetical protein
MENKDMENKETEKKENKELKKLLLILLLLLLLGYGIYAIFIKEDTSEVVNTQTTETEDNQDGTLTPEEVIEQLEGESTLEGDIVMSIVSPEEETFIPNQARLWKAELQGIENDISFAVNCHWKFYLNENNEEVLYKEMENRSGLSKENPQVCAFTSSFIDRVGKLRVVLEAEVVKSGNEVVDTFTAEREYTVL